MSLWTDVPNKLAGDSNQQWNHYMSFKPPYAHSCILQQDGNILYLCVTVCFLRYKLIYLKSLKVSDLHPCLKRCSVRCDEARPCSVSLYSLMGLWGWRVCNEVIFIPRPLFLIWKTWVRSWPGPLMWTWMWWKSTAEQEHTVPGVMEQRFLPPPFSSFSLLIFTLESTSSRYIYI